MKHVIALLAGSLMLVTVEGTSLAIDDQDCQWQCSPSADCGAWCTQYGSWMTCGEYGSCYVPPPPPPPGNTVVYLHGRSEKQSTAYSWPKNDNGQPAFVHHPSWANVSVGYDGNSPIHSTARVIVRNALAQYCRGDQQCVIVCYSAGCARMLLAMEDLALAGTPADRVVWVSAHASAAGGSELAEFATKKGVLLLTAIVAGKQTFPIDFDMSRAVMRGYYGSIQGAATAPMYHVMGKENTCRKLNIGGAILRVAINVGINPMSEIGAIIYIGGAVIGIISWAFGLEVKLCGNKYFPNDWGDGVVPMHSAGGYADANAYWGHCAGGAKYPNRFYEQCAPFAQNHLTLLRSTLPVTGARLAATAVYYQGSDALNDNGALEANISFDDGDLAPADGHDSPNTAEDFGTGQQFSVFGQDDIVCTPGEWDDPGHQDCANNAPGTGGNGGGGGGGYCAGSCGGYSGAGNCYCDNQCWYYGDCCQDACATCGACGDN